MPQLEPSVSIHGVPKSDYDTNYTNVSGGNSGGNFFQKIGTSFKQYWYLWVIGVGAGIILLLVILNNLNNNNSVNQSNAGTTTDTGTNYYSPDQLWGSQLDSDYQQIAQQQNATNGILQQMLNLLNNPSSNPPNTGNTGNNNNGNNNNGNNNNNNGGDSGSGNNNGNSNSLIETIRQRFTVSYDNSYDQNNPQGIPVRSQTGYGNDVTGYIPFGSQVNVISTTPITGGNNIGRNATTGSNLWYQLSSGGYVSASDIASA